MVNLLETEGVTIHFNGIDFTDNVWLDGTAYVTQVKRACVSQIFPQFEVTNGVQAFNLCRGFLIFYVNVFPYFSVQYSLVRALSTVSLPRHSVPTGTTLRIATCAWTASLAR